MTEWIVHNTETQPVDDDVYVEVVLEYDDPDDDSPAMQAKYWDWGPYDGISHYRVVSS